jgi:hypothetical protein
MPAKCTHYTPATKPHQRQLSVMLPVDVHRVLWAIADRLEPAPGRRVASIRMAVIHCIKAAGEGVGANG